MTSTTEPRRAPESSPAPEAARGRSALGRVVRWALTAAILALLVKFAREVDWGDTWRAIRGASPGLLAAAAAVNLLSLAVKGVRWWIFLRPAGARSLGLAVRATTAGAGLNNVLVANGGDAARVLFVTRSAGLPSSTVLATLALDRVFDGVGYVVMLVGAALILPLPAALARFRLPAELLLAAMTLGLAVLALRRRPLAAGRGAAEVAVVGAAAAAEVAVSTSLLGRARRYVGRFARSVSELSSAPRFLAALALSLLAWAGQLACFHLTALAAGVRLPLAGSFAALLAVNAGVFLRATPGNVGVFQLAYALAATHFGAPREPAIAVAMLIQALQILPTTVLGVALAPELVLRRGARR